jgi:aromatic ring-opening dioxygenase catalytic subunit (LigB family)
LAKTLQLQFLNEESKIVTISIDNPIEPVDTVALDAAMDTIISSNVFISAGGDFVSKKGARVVERNVTDIVMA